MASFWFGLATLRHKPYGLVCLLFTAGEIIFFATYPPSRPIGAAVRVISPLGQRAGLLPVKEV